MKIDPLNHSYNICGEQHVPQIVMNDDDDDDDDDGDKDDDDDDDDGDSLVYENGHVR